MNFLGHATFNLGNPEILVGNFIGDYVKGRKILETFPENIKKGILLHRKIDAFTDQHPQVLKSKIYFRPAYRLYAGPCVDHLFDHFLANDPYFYPSSEDLLNFEKSVMEIIHEFEGILPESFRMLFPYLNAGKWLSDIKKIKGLERSFLRLERRGKYMPSSKEAYNISLGHYYELNQRYFEFVEDLKEYVKHEIEKI